MKSIMNLLILLLSISTATAANTLDGDQIMQQSFNIKRVDDQISTLTFLFINAEGEQNKVVYTMAWKNMHGEEGYDNKAVFVTELPLEKAGIAYLGWLHPVGSTEQDDEWIYLPELRMTRRIPQHSHDHSHDDDEFGNSILMREHLEPRPPHLDNNELLDEQLFNNRPHYRISSVPKQTEHHHDDGNAPSKRINWVDKESLLLNRIQFFNHKDELEIDMTFQWQQRDGYWLWTRIEATTPDSSAKTVMEINNTRINQGLKPRLFHKGSLEKGLSYLK